MNEYADFIDNNDNGNYYVINGNYIFHTPWFETLGYLQLFPEIYRLDSLSIDFNGFACFFRIIRSYHINVEASEAIDEYLSKLAYRSPKKFLKYYESVDNIEKRKEIIGTPFWGRSNKDFNNAIKKSKYYDEIKLMVID